MTIIKSKNLFYIYEIKYAKFSQITHRFILLVNDYTRWSLESGVNISNNQTMSLSDSIRAQLYAGKMVCLCLCLVV